MGTFFFEPYNEKVEKPFLRGASSVTAPISHVNPETTDSSNERVDHEEPFSVPARRLVEICEQRAKGMN